MMLGHNRCLQQYQYFTPLQTIYLYQIEIYMINVFV